MKMKYEIMCAGYKDIKREREREREREKESYKPINEDEI